MRRITILMAALLTLSVPATAADLDSASVREMWDRANTCYINAAYQDAIATYDSIAMSGYTSSRLYYNTGNAYFKSGMLGMAIVSYRRALRLNPSDSDAEYNLRVAMTQCKDQIQEMPEFFLNRWCRSVRDSLSGNAWAVLSLILALACIVAAILYMLPQSIRTRKAGFCGMCVCGVLFVICVLFSISEHKALSDPSQAIVTSKSVAVRSQPDGGTELFILHEGTEVHITETFGDWREVSIPDGSKGWLPSSSMETVLIQ